MHYNCYISHLFAFLKFSKKLQQTFLDRGRTNFKISIFHNTVLNIKRLLPSVKIISGIYWISFSPRLS